MPLYEIYKALKYLITSGGIIKLISMGSLFFVISSLGAYGFGEYTIIVASISLLGIFNRIVTGQLYRIEVARVVGLKQYSCANQLKIEAFLIVTVITILFILILAGMYYFFEKNNTYTYYISNYLSYIIFGFIYLFISGYKNILVSTNHGFGYFKEQSQWNVVEVVWRFILVSSPFLFLSIKLTVTHILLIDCIALILGWLTYKLFFQKKYKNENLNDPKNNLSLINIIKQHGIWFFLRLLIVDLTTNIRLWIITSLLSVEATGIFGAARRIVQSGKFLLPFGVILNSILPKYASDEIKLRSAYILGLNVSLILSFSVVVLITFINFTIVPIAFSNMGINLQYLIFILSGMYLVKAWNYSVLSMLGLDRKYRITFRIVLVCFIFMLILLPILVEIFGIFGIAFEIIINSIVAFLISYFFLVKERPNFSLKIKDFSEIFKIINFKQLKSVLRG